LTYNTKGEIIAIVEWIAGLLANFSPACAFIFPPLQELAFCAFGTLGEGAKS
jgi:hypothetical protein